MIKEYFKELRDLEIYEEENGFILFKLQGLVLYIHDVYVKPEHRRSRLAYTIADNLVAAAKELGGVLILCQTFNLPIKQQLLQ